MMTGEEVADLLKRTISFIYFKPTMYGINANEVDLLLRQYHVLYLNVIQDDPERFRKVISGIHGKRHHCNLCFADHYVHHKKGAGNAGDPIEYVINLWKKVDRQLGLDLHEGR